MRGFFVGRFQPFHHGHVRVIEHIGDEVDRVVIGIGSAEQSHTVENPFTAGERAEMIYRAVANTDIRAYATPVPDIESNAKWVSHVVEFCPPFDLVYTNNPLVERLFEEGDHQVRALPVFDREAYRGTEIRRRIIAGEEWGDLVPDPVEEAIGEFNGVARLRRVATNDDPDSIGGGEF